MSAPVMSMFANELDCLRARDKYHIAEVAELNRKLAMALDAMTSLDGTRRTESKLQDVIKEIEGSRNE